MRSTIPPDPALSSAQPIWGPASAETEGLALKREQGIWVFDLPASTPVVTAAQVKALLDDAS